MIRPLILVVVLFAVGVAGATFLRDFMRPAEPAAIGVGPAPAFELTAQDGRAVALADLRGKVVALSFAFTRCGDVCPTAIYKFAWMQEELGAAFGEKVQFLTVTVDPEYDTVEVLEDYAARIGADPEGWHFLTGAEAEIRSVTRRYGVYAERAALGLVDHILLTSLIDRDGVIRVQYLGERFSTDEMLGDLRALMEEGRAG